MSSSTAKTKQKRKKKHQVPNQCDYHDFAQETKESFHNKCQFVKKEISKTLDPFPIFLHKMLDKIDQHGYSSIVSWQSHGRCFLIHKKQEFLNTIMPKYFKQTKYSSFQRQLHVYGFCRIYRKGLDKGGYYHELFLRGKPFLCNCMVRLRVNGKKIRQAGNPKAQPDFYSMPPVMKVLSKEEEYYPSIDDCHCDFSRNNNDDDLEKKKFKRCSEKNDTAICSSSHFILGRRKRSDEGVPLLNHKENNVLKCSPPPLILPPPQKELIEENKDQLDNSNICTITTTTTPTTNVSCSTTTDTTSKYNTIAKKVSTTSTGVATYTVDNDNDYSKNTNLSAESISLPQPQVRRHNEHEVSEEIINNDHHDNHDETPSPVLKSPHQYPLGFFEDKPFFSGGAELVGEKEQQHSVLSSPFFKEETKQKWIEENFSRELSLQSKNEEKEEGEGNHEIKEQEQNNDFPYNLEDFFEKLMR